MGADRQWLVFELLDQVYGFDVTHVREIVSLRRMHVHRLPEAPEVASAVVTLRDRPVGVLDLRLALGMGSLQEETLEIVKMLQEREEDHCRWIQELEACVHEKRPFRLALNPHECKFGRWYDSLLADPARLARLTNQDLALTSLLQQLDQPHKRIHAVGERVLGHATAGKAAEAVQIVDDTRNTVLRSLRSLLANCREQMETARRGVLLVFAGQAGRVGGLADRVCEVVKLSDDQIQPVECENLRKGVFIGIARWGDAGRLIQLLDVPAILRTAV